MRTMMRSTATVGVMAALALTVGTLSTLAARAGSAAPDLAVATGSAVDSTPDSARDSATGSATDAGTGSGAANGIRVQITDDTRSAHSGDVIDYTVRVENDSPTAYPHLEVFHLVPSGFQLVDSTPKATQEGTAVRWTANAGSGRTLIFTDQLMAGTVEESEHLTARARTATSAATAARQFTTTACARDSSSGPALACGTVREQLTDAPDAASAFGGPPAKRWQPGLLGVGLVAALFAAFGGFFRKRKDRAEQEG